MALDSLLLKTVATPADTVAKSEITSKLAAMSKMSLDEFISTLIKNSLEVVIKIVIALAVYYAGRWVIGKMVRIAGRLMDRRGVEVSLRGFVLKLISITLYLFLVMIIIGIMGLNTTGFVAIFASAGMAIGMALSGTLQNFAGGVMVLALRPFRVGDFIEAQGYTGTVKEIHLFNTQINTPDNKMIIIPNGGLATGIINNYSKEQRRRVDWTFTVSYGDDYDLARSVLLELIAEDTRILTEPAPFVGLGALADNSVNITVRGWVESSDYWDVFFRLNERVYKTFPTRGLAFPFPQLDVHVQQ